MTTYPSYEPSLFGPFQRRAWEWCQSYRKKRERTPEFMFAHMTEEVGEAFKEWRRGNFEETTGVKAGVDHPEGLGSELADVVILCNIIAEECGVDLGRSVEIKMTSLEARLEHKLSKKKGKRRG